ncbi:hypothetical protein HMPREF3034_01893 [Prevotella sp. DNF00663]|nr:hypothetical protein HMPREF3034_01893 [Prevotella sp. DNF00663]
MGWDERWGVWLFRLFLVPLQTQMDMNLGKHVWSELHVFINERDAC